jgi:hypothetical protein
VGDLTVGELRGLIREAVMEALRELTDPDYDPDEGLEFRPEVAEQLERFLREKPEGRPLDEVARELGLDD